MKNNDLKMVIIRDCKLKKNIFLLIKEEEDGTNGFKLLGEPKKHFFRKFQSTLFIPRGAVSLEQFDVYNNTVA